MAESEERVKPKDIAIKKGFDVGVQVLYKGELGCIVKHGGGTRVKPKVCVQLTSGVVVNSRLSYLQIYNNVQDTMTLSKKKALSLGMSIFSRIETDKSNCEADGYLVYFCNSSKSCFERVIVLGTNGDYSCAEISKIKLMTEPLYPSFSMIKPNLFKSKYKAGDIVKYKNRTTYIVYIYFYEKLCIFLPEEMECSEDELELIEECKWYV